DVIVAVGLDLTQVARLEAARLAVSLLRAIEALVQPEAELDCLISVFLFRLDLRDHVRPAFNDGCRVDDAALVKNLRHPQLFTDHCLNHWLSPGARTFVQPLGRPNFQSVTSKNSNYALRTTA